MCALASKCFPIELIPWSDGWQRAWWQKIHMMPGLPVSSIPQCKMTCHGGPYLKWFQAIECFEPTFIEAHQASNMSCKVRSLKSRMKTDSFLEDIITWSNKDFKDSESDSVVGTWTLHISTCYIVTSYIIVKLKAVCQILTLDLQARKK